MNIEIKISDIFSRKNILIFFITLFVILLFNGLVIALNYNTSTRTIYYDKINIMNNIINSEGFDLMHICNAINCQEVYLNSTDAYNGRPKYVKYVNNDGILVLDKTDILGKDLPKLITTILTSDLKMYVEKDGYKFILGTEYIKEYSLRLYIITSIIIIILLAPLFIIFCIIRERDNKLNKVSYKNELETTLQRNLTEVIHHEMAVPLALIRTLTDNLFLDMFKCPYRSERACDLHTNLFCNNEEELKKCMLCPNIFNNTRTDLLGVRKLEFLDMYNKIILNIDRLNSILKLLAGAKHIKNSNGNNSLYKIIDNVVSSVNSFKLEKITAYYEGSKKLLEKYALGHGIQNGELMNIVQVLVNNAIEALASELHIRAKLGPDATMNIYFKDNGMGIRDSKNKIVANNKIFEMGYTSKADEEDYKTDSMYIVKIWKYILKKLNVSLVNRKNTRGIGLYISRNVLREAGGDITLVETSASGTTFCINIPIKDVHD